MKDNGNVKTKSSAELRAMRDGRQTAPVSSRQQRLDSYREVIVRRQRDFVETGTALGLIAKDGLFKEAGFGSFEAMVTHEFDMSTSTAYRLVDAARVVTILSQVGTVESKIRNQTQALALAPLGKDREAMVLTIAAAEARGRLTAEVLADVRVELYPHTRIIDGEVVPEKPALVKGMRKAIERAAASVGTGVTYTPAQTSVTLCPVPRDLDNCNVCGVRLRERNAGYLRCPEHDPHQEHIATATLDGLWAECRLCYPTSAAGPAANPEDASPVLGEPVEVEQPQAGAGPESDGTGLGSGQIEERIEEEAAEVEEPPACEKCGTTFVLADPYLAPAHYLRCGACDPYRTHYRTSLPDGPCQICGPTISPAADAMAPPSPQQPGQDSPTGLAETGRSETIHQQSMGVDPAGEAPEDPRLSVQPVELEGDGGTSLASSSSSDPVVIRASVEQMIGIVERLEVPREDWDAMTPWQRRAYVHDFGTEVMNGQGGYGASIESGAPDSDLDDDEQLPSSNDHAADLMTAFGTLVHFLDNADLDAIGPLLLGDDMETLHSHVEAISAYVGKLGRSRFAEMLHTP